MKSDGDFRFGIRLPRPKIQIPRSPKHGALHSNIHPTTTPPHLALMTKGKARRQIKLGDEGSDVNPI